MKITHIVTETTTAGSVATVATPLFKQNRKGGNLLTGTKTKKKYANSVNEGKVKELQMDLSRGVNGISDEEFKQKYGKTKQEMRKLMGPPSKPKSNPQSSKQVDEAKLDEEDLILVPGMGRRLKSGFISNKEDRTDHEVEMARSDLFQSAKNAKKVYELISNISEEQGLEGWVQEKIIKANDYLNTIREYLEHKVMTKEGMAGRLAGGVAGAAITRTPMGAVTGAGIGSDLEDMFREATTGAGVIAGGPQYEGVAEATATQTQWHGSNTDMKWYDAYKNQPVRVKIKNHSGMGSNPAGTYNVRSFNKIDATKAELTINTRMMGEMTGTVDLDNPQTVVTKNYDRVPAMNFYIGSMPVTPRQAFNMFQYQNKPQGVAEGENIGGKRYDKIADLKSRTVDQLNKLIQKFEGIIAKYPDHSQASEYLGLAKMIRAEKIGKKGVAEGKINEKAVSQAQQKFMGMVHATQKGEKPASSEVAKVAKSMPKKAAKDFAQTKHKGLPQHVGKKDKE